MKQRFKFMALLVFVAATLCGCGADIKIGSIDEAAGNALKQSFEQDIKVLNNLQPCVAAISKFSTPIAKAIEKTVDAQSKVGNFSVTDLINKATDGAEDANGNPTKLSSFEEDLISSLDIQPMQKVLPQVCGGLFCGLDTVATAQKNFEKYFYTDGSTFFNSKDTDTQAARNEGVMPFYVGLNGYVSSKTTSADWAKVKPLIKDSSGEYQKAINNKGKLGVAIITQDTGVYSGFTAATAGLVTSSPNNLPSSYLSGYSQSGTIIFGVKVPKFNSTEYCNGTSNAGNGVAATRQIVTAALATAELCGVTSYTFSRADGYGDNGFTVDADTDNYKVLTAPCADAVGLFRTCKENGYNDCPCIADKTFANDVCAAIEVIKKSTAPDVGARTVTYMYGSGTAQQQTRIEVIAANGDRIKGVNGAADGITLKTSTAYPSFTLQISYKAASNSSFKTLFKVEITVSTTDREYNKAYNNNTEAEFETYDGIQGILQMKKKLAKFAGNSAVQFLSYDYTNNTPERNRDTVRSDLIDAINGCNSGKVYVLKARKQSWDTSYGSMMSTLNAFMKKTPADKLNSYTTYFTGTFSNNTVKIDTIDKGLADNFIIPSSTATAEKGTDCEVVLNIKGKGYDTGLFSIYVGSLYKETFNREYMAKTVGYSNYGFLFDALVPDSGGDQILLLKKYPVDAVSKISTSNSTKKYILGTKDTGMLYDIASGDLFINRLSDDSVTMTDADVMNNGSNLLSTGQIYELESIALAPSGNTTSNNTSVNVNRAIEMPKGIRDRMSVLDQSGHEVAGGTFGFKSHLLLMDYAEGMYAPGVYPDEDIVALGLKLRLDTKWVCKDVPYTWSNHNTQVAAAQIPYVESSQTFGSVYIADLMGYTNKNASVTGTGVGDTPNVKNDNSVELIMPGVSLGNKTRTNEGNDAVPNQSTTWSLGTTAGNAGLHDINVTINANGVSSTKAMYFIDNATSICVQLKNVPVSYQVTDASGAHALIENANETNKLVSYSIDVGGHSVTPYTGGFRGAATVANWQVTGYRYDSSYNTANFAVTFALPPRSTTGDTFDVTVTFTPSQTHHVELAIKFKVTYEYTSSTQTAGSGEIVKLRSDAHPDEGTSTATATGHAGVAAYYQDAIETGLLKTNSTLPPKGNWAVGCARRETPNSSKTPYMWVMGCDLMSDTFLSTWIAVDPLSDAASLSKWCNWTASIGLVNYPVDANTTIDDIIAQIDDMLHDVYNFAEVISDDTITFDERVIEVITEQIKREQTKEQYRWITTVCKIIGILLTIYALALIVAWILDVGSNAEGDGLLYKLSFKKMRAAVDREAVGSLNSEHSGTKYIAIGSLAVRAVILIAFGLVLIFVNPIDLVFDIIALVERFTAWISDSVFNE